MNYFSIKFKIAIMAVLFAMSPFAVFAQTGSQTCSSNGYTIITINGILTNKDGAISNRDALKYYFGKNYNGEPLAVDYLHNESHLAGLGDILKSIYQGLFDSETVEDYDLVEMLKTASEKVATQKLLLVAHSQGNFYANSFYDVVADKDGGVPSQSLAIYSVATPSSRVAGSGKWITSDTDKVITGLVARIQFTRKILPSNVHIELQEGDSSSGHGFSDIYLKYQGDKIVSGIESSLDQLKTNNVQDAQKPCLASPKLSIVHKIEGAMFAVADHIANGVSFVAFKLPVAIGRAAVSIVNAGVEKVVEVAQAIKETFSNVFKKDEFQLAQVIDLSQETQLDQSGQASRSANFEQCSFDTQKSASHSKVIINEVAWMGGSGGGGG
ncbi:MAG: hypothetical protein Q8N22_01080 [bacterium]|nr:hypothetical protein [bacterium]